MIKLFYLSLCEGIMQQSQEQSHGKRAALDACEPIKR